MPCARCTFYVTGTSIFLVFSCLPLLHDVSWIYSSSFGEEGKPSVCLVGYFVSGKYSGCTRVSLYPGIVPGYILPGYDQRSQVWYPGSPEYITPCGKRTLKETYRPTRKKRVHNVECTCLAWYRLGLLLARDDDHRPRILPAFFFENREAVCSGIYIRVHIYQVLYR